MYKRWLPLSKTGVCKLQPKLAQTEAAIRFCSFIGIQLCSFVWKLSTANFTLDQN